MAAGERQRWFWRHRRKVMLLFVVLATLVLDVVVGTGLAMAGIHIGPRQQGWHLRRRHPAYHHEFRPNVEYDGALWGAERYRVVTNSLGFKDRVVREVPLRPRGRRFLLIGDSFTEGIGVEYEKTFAGIVAREMAKDGIEVLNAGTYSYSPILYLRRVEWLLEEQGLEFERLLVFIDFSDISDEVQRYSFDEDRNVLDATDDPFDDAIKGFFRDNTILINSVSVLVRRLKERGRKLDQRIEASLNMSQWDFDPEAWEAWGKRGLESATKHMTELAALLRSRDIGLTVCVYPWPDQIHRRERENLQVRHWRNWSRDHGADFIDCFPAFIDGRDPTGVIEEHFFAGDFHWNEKGHAVVAETVIRHLRR